MKKQILTMFTGLFIGAIITGGASAYAAGILAERSSHRIFVDGQEVQMEAYGIAGHNYVKLRETPRHWQSGRLQCVLGCGQRMCANRNRCALHRRGSFR